MKQNETQKQQNVQTEQKDQPIVRVRSNLRAGALASKARDVCI